MANGFPQLRIRETHEQVAAECSQFILSTLAERLRAQPRVTLAISGGSSPRPLFSDMAKAGFNWSNVHIFWVDERCVPPTDDRSNYKMAEETLLRPAKIPPQNIHRIYGELPPDEAAARYVSEIKQFFNQSALPSFDILHRGMGAEGHTASLFPGEPLIRNETEIAAHIWVEKLKMDRVTLLPGVLRAAACTVLQVAGAEKADAVRMVLRGEKDEMNYPCQIASRDEKAIWFLDETAAARL